MSRRRLTRRGGCGEWSETSVAREQQANSFPKVVFGRDQAHNKIAVTGKIVEVPRMNRDAVGFEDIDGGVFVRARGGRAKDRVPAAFDREARAEFLRGELAVEFGEIGVDAPKQFALKFRAAREKYRQRVLDRRAHGKVRIGNHLEAFERL